VRAASLSVPTAPTFASTFGFAFRSRVEATPLGNTTHSTEPRELEGAGAHDPALLGATVCLKLNGGLGTGMGLEKAKSLLAVKDGLTFLDYIALQILHLRQQHKHDVKFVLMNSFATSDDTRAALAKCGPNPPPQASSSTAIVRQSFTMSLLSHLEPPGKVTALIRPTQKR